VAKKLTYEELEQRVRELERETAERKRVEEALRESEERHRTLFEDSREAVYITTRDGNFVDVNQSFLDLFGCSREEIRDLRVQDFYVNPDDRHQFQGEIEEKGSVRDFEVKLRKRDGAEMYCLITAKVRQAENGDILGYQGIIRDITKHKRTDEALQESEEKYRSILESMEEGYFEVDLAGNLTFFNDALCRITGFPRSELMGMNNREYTTPEAAKRMYQIFNKVYRTGKPARVMDHEIIAKDGKTVILEMSTSLMCDSAGEPIGFRGVVRDVTEREQAEEERKKLEAQLMQAQKMEAIGTIAGGVAHNFRNILTVISMNTQVLQQRYRDDFTLQGIADVLNSYVERGAQLVNGLTQFSRKHTEEKFQPLNLAGVIRETYELISKSFDKMINISLDIPESLPILGDHAGLTQALMNLCTNARDAMPGGGELHIAASRRRSKAFVVVSDTGQGMDKETREQCFDPFFTTKEVNKGTGLGLSTSYGIVKEHGGEIHVYSEIGKGTTFKLSFPLDVSGQRGKQEPSVEISRGKGQRILVVDDEIAVCKAVKHLLEGFGYHVTHTSSGKGAIAKYKSWHPDAVLLDRNMPEMDGLSCAGKIMDYDPNAKIVIISGYDEHGTFALDEEGKRLIKAYLTKPIDMSEMSTLLARVLE
jgi:two-component system cell cycle sensor histidine kinase/response regulator CckA